MSWYWALKIKCYRWFIGLNQEQNSADRYLIWICDPRLERLLKLLLNVSDVLHPVKLLTLLGFFQCAFVTTAALKWFSWYPAIVNIPQSGVPQLGEMFWLDLLQQLWLKLALVLLHLCQITDRWRCPNMTPEREAASLIIAPMPDKMFMTRCTASLSVCSTHSVRASVRLHAKASGSLHFLLRN